MRYIITIFALLLTSCSIKLDSSAVDAEKYLHGMDSSAAIYKKGAKGTYYTPFNFSHTDFGRLLLISIDDHPAIKTVELVVQNDGKGAFVVVYYHNGQVESYTNAHLSLQQKYLKPNADWSIISHHDFSYRFENTPKGISFLLDITIKTGERLEINLQENNVEAQKYSFLAAVGADLSAVKRFPFIYLNNAGFIPIENTTISFKINNKEMTPTVVPVKVEGKKCYKTIYALTPLPFFWNEEREEDLTAKEMESIQKNPGSNVAYTFGENSGHSEIKQIRYKANKHVATYTFAPAFPDIMSMKEGTLVEGKFCLGIDEITGVVCGEYSVRSRKDGIKIEIDPEKCWQPMPGSDWVSLYHYDQQITFIKHNHIRIKSQWIIEK
jgi:hypothetical protein